MWLKECTLLQGHGVNESGGNREKVVVEREQWKEHDSKRQLIAIDDWRCIWIFQDPSWQES